MKLTFGSALRMLDSWLFARVPAHALGIYRLSFGLFSLCYWLLKIHEVPAMLSDEGIVFPYFDAGSPDFIAYFFQPPPLWTAWLIYLVLLFFILLFTIGQWTRVSAAVVFYILSYYWFLSSYLFPSVVVRSLPFFFLLFAFSDAGKALSLEMRRRHGSFFTGEKISAFIQRIMCLQISGMYLGVGWMKVVLPAWRGGEVLWYSFMDHAATPVAFWFMRLGLPLWAFGLIVFTIKVFECTLPFGLWMRRWQPFYFAGGIIFHILLIVFLGMWMFLFMPLSYILFIEPEKAKKIVLRMAHGQLYPART